LRSTLSRSARSGSDFLRAYIAERNSRATSLKSLVGAALFHDRRSSLLSASETLSPLRIVPRIADTFSCVYAIDSSTQARSSTTAFFSSRSHQATNDTLRLPAPQEFLWQYVYSTPLAAAATELDHERRAEFAREVVSQWEPFVERDALILPLRVVIATARAM
jgi:hypothetical protein